MKIQEFEHLPWHNHHLFASGRAMSGRAMSKQKEEKKVMKEYIYIYTHTHIYILKWHPGAFYIANAQTP
jgi:hypothetical protein